MTKDAIPKLKGPTPAIPSSSRTSITSCRARNSTSGVENSDETDKTDETKTTEPGRRSPQEFETESPAGKNHLEYKNSIFLSLEYSFTLISVLVLSWLHVSCNSENVHAYLIIFLSFIKQNKIPKYQISF